MSRWLRRELWDWHSPNELSWFQALLIAAALGLVAFAGWYSQLVWRDRDGVIPSSRTIAAFGVLSGISFFLASGVDYRLPRGLRRTLAFLGLAGLAGVGVAAVVSSF